MSSIEIDALAKGLLKYCELDTLAMVMIFEYWMDEIKKKQLNYSSISKAKAIAIAFAITTLESTSI